MKRTVKDWKDANITHVITKTGAAVGYVEFFAPCEFKAFRADGSFVDWFSTKKAAVAAL